MTSHETEDEEKKRVRYLKIRLPSRAAAAKEEATRRRRRQTKAPRVSSFRRGHERTRTGGKKPRRRPPAGAAGARAPPSRPRRSPADAPRHRARERERGEGESRDGGGGCWFIWERDELCKAVIWSFLAGSRTNGEKSFIKHQPCMTGQDHARNRRARHGWSREREDVDVTAMRRSSTIIFFNKFALYYMWGGTFTSWNIRFCTNSGRGSIQICDQSRSQFKPIRASSCAHILLERDTWTTLTLKKFMDIGNFASLNNTPEAEKS